MPKPVFWKKKPQKNNNKISSVCCLLNLPKGWLRLTSNFPVHFVSTVDKTDGYCRNVRRRCRRCRRHVVFSFAKISQDNFSTVVA